MLLLEGSAQVGGKLRLAEVAGVTVDVGAEAMLNRRPEGVDLARELGLEVVHPTTASSRLWTRGELRPLPRSLMGVPLDVDGLAASGVLSDEGLAHVRAEPALPPTELIDDVSVGDLVASRFGDEVVDRLVEPLLGGVYAGHARLLSARATTPQLVSLLARGGSLLEAAAELPTSDAPVFAGLPGGMGRLPTTLVDTDLFTTRTDATVRELRRTGDTASSWSSAPPATPEPSAPTPWSWRPPPRPTARLLADLAPSAAAELAAVEYASMAVVTLAFHATDVALPDSSGFLVPPVDGRRIKASTFSFAKWDWVREAGLDPVGGDDLLLLRTSLGRHREEASLQATDDELVAASLADLAEATGLRAQPRRQPRAAVGRRPPAVRRRAPRPGRADPRRRGPDPGSGGVRRGVRRRRDPGRDRVRPAGGGAGRRGDDLDGRQATGVPSDAVREAYPAASLATYGPGRPEPMVRPSTDSTGVTPPMVPVTNTSSAL